MLDEQEQRLRDERACPERAQDHEGPGPVPAPIVGGVWAAVFLVLFGVFPAALAVGAVTTLMWVLWRFLPRRDAGASGPAGSDALERGRPARDEPALLWHQAAPHDVRPDACLEATR